MSRAYKAISRADGRTVTICQACTRDDPEHGYWFADWFAGPAVPIDLARAFDNAEGQGITCDSCTEAIPLLAATAAEARRDCLDAITMHAEQSIGDYVRSEVAFESLLRRLDFRNGEQVRQLFADWHRLAHAEAAVAAVARGSAS